MNFLLGYLAFAGTAVASLQASRGVARGISRLVEGDHRAALAEVVGGLVAPARSVVVEAAKMAVDAMACAASLCGEGEEALPPQPSPLAAHARRAVA